MSWVTKVRYVDIHTGEIITKEEADKKYRIVKTQIHSIYESGYGKNRWVKWLTKLCSNEGKQRNLFGD